MADEKLRLQAEVQDNMSPALRKIRDQLNSIRVSPGMEAATDQMKKLGDGAKDFATKGASVAGMMDALGVGGLATAGGLAAVVAQMRELGQRSLDMKEFARETGVSVDWLNAWSHAGQHFGVSADAMNTALNSLSAQMPGLESRTSELYALLAQRWPTLADKLLGDNPEQRMKDVVNFLNNDAKLRADPQLQKKLAGEFFSNPDDVEKLFRDGATGFWDEFNKQAKALDPINKDLLKQAQVFRDAQIGFNDALDNFENSTGPAFLKQMTSIVDEARTLMDDLGGKKANPGEPNKLWGSLSSGDVTGFGSELAKVFANSVMTELGLSEKQKADLLSSAPAQAPHPAPSGRYGYHPSSFEGNSNGLFQRTSYGDPVMRASDAGLAGLISDGTKSGVLAAFRELMAGNEADQSSAGGGFAKASYETSGGDPVAVGRAIGRLDGSASGGAYHDPNAFYDAIISAEGTGKHGSAYDTSLGYTKSPVPLTSMTLAQSLEWGDWIRKHTRIGELTNSSAKGAFQIVNATQRLAMKALGLHMDDLFSETNQQRMASWIAHRQGLGAWASMSTHPRQYAQALRALKSGEDGQYRRATGLAASSATGSGGAGKAAEGHIRADIHVHGDARKATVKTRGAIEASLHRWPSVQDWA
ncbi:hypothetical protein CWB41_04640 [Methylovirgula ligni]|uniref:Phage tail lysozyme domain-containing protein n=1 Tax=Methylovirgula ligni TaxID=569860 RepID=A0A3D9Z3D4_9HYPH|nr:hypothetical protein [Methylovirgula ligni]QAY95102.1 hypothetical protein CWB41_04640 [Methylovirgula ligni]REF89617.1 hypothetical protein DES32_0844 [Methylovirgula ligni]